MAKGVYDYMSWEEAVHRFVGNNNNIDNGGGLNIKSNTLMEKSFSNPQKQNTLFNFNVKNNSLLSVNETCNFESIHNIESDMIKSRNS